MSGRSNRYKYPGAKRLMLEAQELREKTEDYCAQPIDDNLFEWHFTVRGPPETAFEGGFYHGRLSFPTEYPMKPPSIILLTPNGRFETNKKICLSISGFHPETWQPSWSVRTALLALIAFMPTKGNRAIGSLDYSDLERRKLARHSRTWRCETCGPIRDLLRQPDVGCSESDGNQCGAGTPRVNGQGSSESGAGLDEMEPSSDRSETSEDEARDSSTDSQGSAPTSDTVGIREKPSSREEAERNLGSLENEGGSESEVVVAGTRETVVSNEGEGGPETATRRSSSPFVFLSIFVLLFLLIARRVIIILQS